MIEVKKFVMPEIVPPGVVESWRQSLKEIPVKDLPKEVVSFINAISAKMSDFGTFNYDTIKVSGHDMMLCGIKEINGQAVEMWEVYDVSIPRRVAVDHRKWMLRIFHRKGKAGLIDYCKAQVKKTDLERVLQVLEVNVFHNERPEFKKMMEQINTSKKLE